MTEPRTLTDVVVVAMPGRPKCPVCVDGVFDGRPCPRCHGDGVEPFFAGDTPTCGHADCGCTGMAMVGYADEAETEPVFECSNGQHTAVRFTEPVAEPAEDGAIGWAVLELAQGRERVAGFVREGIVAGVPGLWVDRPCAGGGTRPQFYVGSALYTLTPTNRDIALIIAMHPEASVEPRAPLERGHAEGVAASAPPADSAGAQ